MLLLFKTPKNRSKEILQVSLNDNKPMVMPNVKINNKLPDNPHNSLHGKDQTTGLQYSGCESQICIDLIQESKCATHHRSLPVDPIFQKEQESTKQRAKACYGRPINQTDTIFFE